MFKLMRQSSQLYIYEDSYATPVKLVGYFKTFVKLARFIEFRVYKKQKATSTANNNWMGGKLTNNREIQIEKVCSVMKAHSARTHTQANYLH